MFDSNSGASQSWFARHKMLTAIGGIFIFFILTAAMFGGESSTHTTNQSGSSGAPNDAQEVGYGLGDEVTVGDVKWVITDAYTKTSLFGAFSETETTQGKFVVINATVENLGTDMKSMSNLTLVDSLGREFTNSSTSFKNLGAEQLYILENLNPNLPFTFADVYEVSADAEGLSVVVGDLSLFGSEEAQISLGL